MWIARAPIGELASASANWLTKQDAADSSGQGSSVSLDQSQRELKPGGTEDERDRFYGTPSGNGKLRTSVIMVDELSLRESNRSGLLDPAASTQVEAEGLPWIDSQLEREIAELTEQSQQLVQPELSSGPRKTP